MVIMTEWNVLRALDLARVQGLTNSPVVVHLRNVCGPEEMTRHDLADTCVGRG
jgi:UDPglucose 6-dehydrogenase